MLHSMPAKFTTLAAACLLSVGSARSAHAEGYLLTALGSLDFAYAINDRGQVVGIGDSGGVLSATEWSRGAVINLGGLPG